VAALRAEHSELQRQLKTTPRDAVRDVVAKEASNVIAATNGASVAGFDESAAAQATRAQLLARVHEQTERRALDELHTAYRLTGKTIVKLKDQLGGATALRFDTCFDGEPFFFFFFFFFFFWFFFFFFLIFGAIVQGDFSKRITFCLVAMMRILICTLSKNTRCPTLCRCANWRSSC
jgi:hypothetical protein